MNELKRRLSNILIGFDQFLQVLIYLGNYTPDETISGVIGRKIRKNKANKIEKAVCWFLRKLQSQHCLRNIDEQENIKGERF